MGYINNGSNSRSGVFEKIVIWETPGLHFASLFGAATLHLEAIGVYLDAVPPLDTFGHTYAHMDQQVCFFLF